MERFAWHQFRYRGSGAGAWPNFRCLRPTASIVHRRIVSAIHFLGVTRHRSSLQANETGIAHDGLVVVITNAPPTPSMPAAPSGIAFFIVLVLIRDSANIISMLFWIE
jgi:hypothetical protein